MRSKAVLSAAMPLLLAACTAVGPEYHTPRVPVAEGEDFTTRSAAFDPTAPVPDDWWQIYRDPHLDALVERALVANTDLREAASNLEAAMAVLQEARAGRLPSTTTSGGLTYGDAIAGGAGQGAGIGTLGDADFSANAGLDVAYQVDLFGRVTQTIRAALADAQAVEAARDSVRVTVAAETTRSYLNACAYAYALAVARESHQTSLESLRLFEALERAGSVGLLDVERAGAAAASARADIPALEAQRQVALFELAALLGTTPDEIPQAASECEAPPEPIAALPVGDGTALLRRRPDIRQAERELAADTARIGVAMADLYPTISLGGSGNFFGSNAIEGEDSFSFSLGPLISWNFPNLSVARARIRLAEAEQEAALARFDGRVLAALRDVEQALTNVANEQQRLASLEEARERSNKAYEFADLRYRAGSVGLLDVLVAQSDLIQSRAAYSASLQRLSSARVDLFKALGGGWQQSSELAANGGIE
ncbi:efflux transporter outer membrane subunit [Aurantiacibacter poecillastricola]|uniref:efflux transporter outer membrane subunit n=1 Tax=Aurantiacibacter poecillastricola TaxID=3064385 RepID=UPI00273F432F|nr:efflux transporter outer membrane subunit [Aurantiacibacter sp. 219JJ12-13]MDP5263323.1 efflux transporter outer membrane subunit [Aurantiacibacter sp. 219JJ12-13]